MSTPRLAREGDLRWLQEVEIAAGRLFLEVGMPEIAGDEPLSIEHLDDYRTAGRAWVIDDAAATPVAYVLADVLDGHAHVEQVSVHPDAAGRALGARLIDEVAAWARASAMPAVTLTTFRGVPWNAPYYARLGFRVLGDDEIGPELRARCVDEQRLHGLDPAQRVCMRREV